MSFWFPRSSVGTHTCIYTILTYAFPRRAWEREITGFQLEARRNDGMWVVICSTGFRNDGMSFWFPRSSVGTHTCIYTILTYAFPRRAWEREITGFQLEACWIDGMWMVERARNDGMWVVICSAGFLTLPLTPALSTLVPTSFYLLHPWSRPSWRGCKKE